MILTDKDISYSEPEEIGMGVRSWQHIMYKGENIGALMTSCQGILEPLRESYEFVTALPEKTLQDCGFIYSETESECWLRIYCDSIEEFIDTWIETKGLEKILADKIVLETTKSVLDE